MENLNKMKKQMFHGGRQRRAIKGKGAHLRDKYCKFYSRKAIKLMSEAELTKIHNLNNNMVIAFPYKQLGGDSYSPYPGKKIFA